MENRTDGALSILETGRLWASALERTDLSMLFHQVKVLIGVTSTHVRTKRRRPGSPLELRLRQAGLGWVRDKQRSSLQRARVRRPATLIPAQQETLGLIRLPADQRTTYEATLRHELHAALEAATADLVGSIDEPLWISKRQLQAVNGCEALYEAQQAEPFEWYTYDTRPDLS